MAADPELAEASDRQQGLERFFNELTPRLEAARTVERELDRQLARQFNAFDYLRPDELRLSKMIGDLLDPEGPHGQGPVFLRLLLDRVGFARSGDLRNSRVDVERLMENQRRLDVAVDIGGGRHCLAIENKPFAGDQENQIKVYLDRLRKKYGDRFLLIYLSPRGEAPSDYSVKRTELLDEAGNPARTFRIMPYHRAEDGAEDDDFEPFRTGFGLADWLRECREHCDVERLRWFLREAETFLRETIRRKRNDDGRTQDNQGLRVCRRPQLDHGACDPGRLARDRCGSSQAVPRDPRQPPGEEVGMQEQRAVQR